MKKLGIVFLAVFTMVQAPPIKLPHGKKLINRLSGRFIFLITSTPIVQYLENTELEMADIEKKVDTALDACEEIPKMRSLLEDFNFKSELLKDIINPLESESTTNAN